MTAETLEDVLAEAQQRGFLGPGPVEGHVSHAEAFLAALVGIPGTAVDLGSGGGVPGLVLAERLPSTRWLLVESMARRTAFLREAVRELGVSDRVTVVEDRAERAATDCRGTADLVTARSFGPPAVTAECAAPFLRTGGWLLVSEPPGGDPGRWPAQGLAILGQELDQVFPGPPALVRLRQGAPCPEHFPRRTGKAAKRPLW